MEADTIIEDEENGTYSGVFSFTSPTGHFFCEKRVGGSIWFCAVCSSTCSFFGRIYECERCEMKVHTECVDLVYHRCKKGCTLRETFLASAQSLDRANSSKTKYCMHCGERIPPKTKFLQCKICKKKFHTCCKEHVMDNCMVEVAQMKENVSPERKLKSYLIFVEDDRSEQFEVVGLKKDYEMGKLITGICKKSGKKCILKLFPKYYATGFRTLKSLWDEAGVLIRIYSSKLPFIAEINFILVIKQETIICMEPYTGCSLAELVKKKQRTEKFVQNLLAEIIIALEYLHRIEVVYGGLCFDNVFIDIDGHVKLYDFSIAKLAGNKGLSADDYEGSIETVPPEVACGMDYSYPADFWALGVIMYQLFHDKHPFFDSDTVDFIEAILYNSFSIEAEMSIEARDFLSRLLTKDTFSRLGSGRHGIKELKTHPWFCSVNWDEIESLERLRMLENK